MSDAPIELLLAVWLAVAAFVVLYRLRQHVPSTGLILSYVAIFWLNYWPGAAVFALPWYLGSNPETVNTGFAQCVYAACAFALAAAIAIPLGRRTAIPAAPSGAHLPRSYLIAGIISYFLINTAFGRLPTMRALVSTSGQLLVVGLCLLCWRAWQANDRRKFAAAVGGVFVLPFVTIVTQGYLGYGTIPALSVVVFALGLVRLRARYLLAGLLAGFLGLSLYVTYMRDRDNIRAVVWRGGAYRERLESVSGLVTDFEWFDPWNQEHLSRIENRLDQARIIGMAVDRLDGTEDFGYGETFRDAALALIPRVVWPEKTVFAGSGDVVTRYTGLQYDHDTSVGIGQVLEFYINFGTIGVFAGFFVIGLILTVIDMGAAYRLAAGDLKGFVLWYLPGFALLQIGGSFVEVTASAGAGIVVAVVVNRIVDRITRDPGEPAARAAEGPATLDYAQGERA
jgi:hypothetical protein